MAGALAQARCQVRRYCLEQVGNRHARIGRRVFVADQGRFRPRGRPGRVSAATTIPGAAENRMRCFMEPRRGRQAGGDRRSGVIGVFWGQPVGFPFAGKACAQPPTGAAIGGG